MVQVNDRDNDLLYSVATALFTRLKQIREAREAPPELGDSAMALLRDFRLQTKLSLPGFRPPSAQSAVRPPDFRARKIFVFEFASVIDKLWELDSGSGDEQASSASDGDDGVKDAFLDHVGEGGVDAAAGANERTGTLSQCELCCNSSCRIRDSKTCQFRQQPLRDAHNQSVARQLCEQLRQPAHEYRPFIAGALHNTTPTDGTSTYEFIPDVERQQLYDNSFRIRSLQLVRGLRNIHRKHIFGRRSSEWHPRCRDSVHQEHRPVR